MPVQQGRDLLLKIGDGAAEETFAAIGAARQTALYLDNRPVDATTIADGGMQRLCAAAGVQSMTLRLEGLFRDSAAEKALRDAAFTRTSCNFLLQFPCGDSYAAPFVVEHYSRGGTHDGLETFAVTLARAGAGVLDLAEAEED